MNDEYIRMMEQNNCEMTVKLTKFDGSVPIKSRAVDRKEWDAGPSFAFEDSVWQIRSSFARAETDKTAIDCEVTFSVMDGQVDETGVSVSIALDRWSKENYVLMPAAAYNGNRFKVTAEPYPPMLNREDEVGLDIPTTITDVPRLNLHDGLSRMELRTGDFATPAVGCYRREQRSGFFLLTTQGTLLGDTGITMEENDDRTKAVITLSAPAVRQYAYTMCNSSDLSNDRGVDFRQGDEVTLKFRLYFFDCPDIPDLFHYFADIRKDLTPPPQLRHEIPFSAAWDIIEEKYNRDNWQKEYAFYRSSTSPHEVFGEWQTGWVGGGISTYPMLFLGNELSKQRSMQTLDFMFSTIQAPSGFFYGIHCKGKLYGDAFHAQEQYTRLLLRKHADAVYFLVKQFMLMDKMQEEIPAHWRNGLIKACDALVRLWQRYGQFGQFVDVDTEEITIGGSASAGIAPGALALAGQYFGRNDYSDVAKEAAEHYYDGFVSQGVTTGAPGEICQCPDSESAFALLESYVALYEVTGAAKWLKMAELTAKLCATWSVSYDFEYSPDAEFSKLDLRPAGSVWASVQNKHAAPGICTFSGVSLFKLYRATGNGFYLELLREIAHNLPQYLSREDRPLQISWGGRPSGSFSPPGWMGERVNTSDWEGKENIGEVAGGSCWCEVSAMLTYFEVPGIYIQKDTGYVCAIDHIDAQVVANDSSELRVILHNPTKFTANIKVFAEYSDEMRKTMGENSMIDCQTVTILPYTEQIISFDKR